MISAKQQKILAFPYSRYDALICDGAVRSGKTSLMMWAFIGWAMREFSGQRFGICGKTVDSATKNIVVPFVSMHLAQQRYTLRWRRSDKLLEVRRGPVVNWFEVFGGKDESSFALIQGRTLAGVLLDEVVLMPESFVNQALARCSVEGARLWFSCNPGSPQHWFKRSWIDHHRERNALYLHFTLDDNPALSDAVKARYHAMYSGVFYERYVLGRWVLAEGLVYTMFDAGCILAEPPARGRYFLSIDYGTLNPFAALLWCVDGQRAVAVREYYYSGRQSGRQKTDEEYYTALEQLAAGREIEQVVIDPSAASMIEVIRRHGRWPVRKAVNDVLPGILTTARLLRGGQLKVCRSCENTIREFGLYRWDEAAAEDKPIKADDHAMDAVRYF